MNADPRETEWTAVNRLGYSVRVSTLRAAPRCFDRAFVSGRRSNSGLLCGVDHLVALRVSLL
jgi:hypothetical protein